MILLPKAMERPSIFKQAIGLAACLSIVYVAAFAGAIASATAGDFYATLSRPSWAPPGWIFGPVWSLLYTMMGIATWLVWRRSGISQAIGAHLLNFGQLAVNALWSWLFFKWHLGAFAFVEICVLWILIVLTIRTFWKVQPLAGILLLPYLLWVSFAILLAYTMWRANPTVFG